MFSFFLAFIVGVFILGLLALYLRQHSVNKKLIQQSTLVQGEMQALEQSNAKLKNELDSAKVQVKRMIEDPITHLPGWQLFEDRLYQSIKESERYQLTLGVLFINIDDFKVINDALSYEIGDLLLLEVAQRLQLCIRQVDSISRFSKDTFVTSLTQLTKPEASAVVAQRMLKSLAQPFFIKEKELYLTACIGIAIYPIDGKDTAGLLRSADHALHLAKEKGNHTYQFYQERMYTQSLRELAIYTALSKEAIYDEFTILYQPIINGQNEAIVCMDALLHWQHPDCGLIQSREILLLADKQRKSNALTEWLLYRAGRQFLKWQSLGFQPALLGLPLTMQQLENTQFIYRLSQILQELAFPAGQLLLEIKEMNADLSQDMLEKSFNMLKYLGVKLAIDGFGSGIFSLNHLKNFPIHYLKIDPCLIADIDTNPKTIKLVISLLMLTQSLEIQMIIQGVDRPEQLTLLKNAKVDLLQGDLLCGPLPSQEVIEKMMAT